MDSRRTRRLALALLGMLAVAFAATAAAPLFAAGPVDETPPSADRGPDQSDTDGSGIPGDPDLVLVAVLAVAAIGALAQFVRDPARTFALAVKLSAVGALGVAVLSYVYRNVSIDYFVAEESSEPAPIDLNITDTPTPGGPVPEGDTGGLGAVPTGDTALVALVVVAVGAATVLAWRSGTVRALVGLERDGPDPEPEEGLDQVGRVAGEAADQVDAASTPAAADDAVYGAWRDMVDLLDIGDPQSETPRQFARAATDAGMDPDDVSVLTRSFEEARYGDTALSEERLSRAVAALRRIEAAHADDGSGGDDNDAVGDHEDDAVGGDRTNDDGADGHGDGGDRR